jgi:Pyridoxamine 5'-phosphate oxidase
MSQPMAPELPADVVEFLRLPQHAVIGFPGPGGRPRTVATWYDWDDGEILVNMDATRKRLARLQVGTPVSLTVLDAENWYRHVSLYGRISRRADDGAFADADRLAERYTGRPYADHDAPRVTAWMTIDSWFGWVGGEPWPGPQTAG